ncbi:hypothetical protein AK830_g10846 [Neonectria ditissima]|uniref:non-specific serine/threonine protein kinase n=1 Tax=Neonectria ditissima TaxID=78410 RepID=A0A0P7ASG4_9HYPO|nr:hypothetical protein AK830_g10846 [Neonectria ditissima]
MSGWFSRRTLLRRTCPRRWCHPSHRFSTRQPHIFSDVPNSISASDVEYGYIENVERLSDYRTGGYHPVLIEGHLHNRYRIVHKLGHGTFSTAWLALDKQTSGYVAIKVGTADADSREADVMSQLTTRAATCSHAMDKASMIPKVIDRFSLDGPNGTHPCFVTVPARCSLMDAKEASDPRLFQLDVARSLAAQLAMAVSLVHSQGYVHGVEQLYAKFGAPEPEPIVRLDGKPTSSVAGVPSHAVPPVWLGIASDEIALGEAKLLLGDFGVAFRPSEKSRFESYTHPLSLIDGILTPQDEITAQQVELQGPLPSEWWDNWKLRSKWFDEAGKPLSKESDIWSWDRRFEQWIQEPRESCGMSVIDEEEKNALFELLHRMLAYRPGERPNAEQVLDMAWMKRWALPAYEESRKAWALKQYAI